MSLHYVIQQITLYRVAVFSILCSSSQCLHYRKLHHPQIAGKGNFCGGLHAVEIDIALIGHEDQPVIL